MTEQRPPAARAQKVTNQQKHAVLYLHRTQGHGVEQVHILGIARALQAAGKNVDIFSPSGLERLSSSPSISKRSGIAVQPSNFSLISKHAPEFLFELAEIAYNAIALYRLRSVDFTQYDFIFERYSIFSVFGCLLAKAKRLPLVVEVNYTSKSPLVRRRSKLLRPLAYAIDRWLFKSAALLTPVSSSLKAELIRDFGVPEEKILVLPNAADPQKFTPQETQCRPTKTKAIGFVGGFYPWHGLDLLIEAFSLISNKFPDAQVILVGDGPELEKIRALTSDMGLTDRVIFGGRMSHEELPRIMSDFYIGVMPDSNDYGSPMKIFEYMALGIPIVAPDYTPILDVLTDGKQGLVFRRQDVAELAARLARLLQDEAFARRIGACGRLTVERVRNWDANVTKIFSSMHALGLTDNPKLGAGSQSTHA